MRAIGDWLAGATRVLMLALIVVLPLFAGYMFTERMLAAGIAALAMGLLACVAAGLRSREVHEGLGAAAWPIAGFLAWQVVATTTSVYLHASLLSVLAMAGYVAVLAVCASLFRAGGWRRWAWVAVAVAGAIEGIVGLRDWTQTAIFQGDLSWRIFGTMYNPNVVAGYFICVIPAAVLVLAMAWHRAADDDERPRYGLIAAGFAVLIPSLALLLTASRAGILGAMLAGAVLIFATPNRIRGRWVAVGIIALVALVLVAPPLRNRILSAATQSHSAIFRWYTWVGTAKMVAARPIVGFGPGTFEHAYPQYAITGFTRMAHQTPLQIAAEAGIPGLLLMLGAIWMLVRPMAHGLSAGGIRAVEIAAGLAAMAGLGLQNLADYTWYVPAVGMTLSAVVGLSLSAARGESQGGSSHPRRWLCWSAAVAMLAAIIVAGVGLQAQLLALRGKQEIGRGRYQLAMTWLRRAAELDPLDAEIVEDLAQATAASPLGGLERAVTLRLQAAELNPTKAGNYLALAYLYRELGDLQSAVNAARRALEVHPGYARGYVVLAQLQEQMGLEQQALETWRALERVYQSPVGQYQAVEGPTDVSWAYGWVALGQSAEERGEPDEAARYYERAAELAGGYAERQRRQEEALRAIGAFNEREVEEAEALAEEARAGLERIEDARDGRDDR